MTPPTTSTTAPTAVDARAVDAFAKLLAAEEDPPARARLMKRAQMAAMNGAPEEAFDVALKVESLADVASGDLEPPPVLVPGVIVEGQVNWLAGHPASAKTTISMHAALTAVRQGRPVLWLDFEGGRRPTARRLVAMGATAADFAAIHYAGFPRLGADPDALAAITGRLDQLDDGPLVVFDSASKALAAAGLDENSPTEATRWTTEVVMPLRERATVIVIDHVTKGATRSTPYARGAGSKLADTEVFWFVEAEEKFNRERPGTILLTKHKDREGVLPERVRFKVGDGQGRLPVERIDVDEEDGVAGATRAEGVQREVRELLAKHDGKALTGNQIVGMVSGRRTDVLDALKQLSADDSEPVAAEAGPNRSVLYRFDAAAATALEV